MRGVQPVAASLSDEALNQVLNRADTARTPPVIASQCHPMAFQEKCQTQRTALERARAAPGSSFPGLSARHYRVGGGFEFVALFVSLPLPILAKRTSFRILAKRTSQRFFASKTNSLSETYLHFGRFFRQSLRFQERTGSPRSRGRLGIVIFCA
jgi:hypothetical protein